MIFQKVIFTLGTVLAVSFAIAGDKNDDKKSDLFDALDADKDGMISMMEAKSHEQLFAAFNELDVNGDELLSPEEFTIEKLNA